MAQHSLTESSDPLNLDTAPDLDEAKAALAVQKAVIVTLAKARNFSAMPVEHMRLRQLERLVQSLTNIRR